MTDDPHPRVTVWTASMKGRERPSEVWVHPTLLDAVNRARSFMDLAAVTGEPDIAGTAKLWWERFGGSVHFERHLIGPSYAKLLTDHH